jgi:reactive intermediate/imine deaminase
MRITILLLGTICTGLAGSAQTSARQAVQPPGFATGRPFSPGVWAGDTLHVAGQIGSDLKTGKLGATFEDETKLALDNIGLILKEAGLSFDDVVTVHVYLTDIGLFGRMNAIYMPYFQEPRPARTTVAVAALAGGAHIEITVTAHSSKAKNKGKK